jgi:hypothetical protein
MSSLTRFFFLFYMVASTLAYSSTPDADVCQAIILGRSLETKLKKIERILARTAGGSVKLKLLKANMQKWDDYIQIKKRDHPEKFKALPIPSRQLRRDGEQEISNEAFAKLQGEFSFFYPAYLRIHQLFSDEETIHQYLLLFKLLVDFSSVTSEGDKSNWASMDKVLKLAESSHGFNKAEELGSSMIGPTYIDLMGQGVPIIEPRSPYGQFIRRLQWWLVISDMGLATTNFFVTNPEVQASDLYKFIVDPRLAGRLNWGDQRPSMDSLGSLFESPGEGAYSLEWLNQFYRNYFGDF